jgi:hypothetical protein
MPAARRQIHKIPSIISAFPDFHGNASPRKGYNTMKNLDFTISISGISKKPPETLKALILLAFPHFRKPLYYIYGYASEMHTHRGILAVRRKFRNGGVQ